MPYDEVITGLPLIKVKNVETHSHIYIDCEDISEHYCPYCGSFSLRKKDCFHRNIKSISISLKPSIMRIKTIKYRCKDCGKYFNSTPQGVLKHQQTSEPLKREVFHRHCQGVSKKSLSLDLKVSDSSVERWFNHGYNRKNLERKNSQCPLVLGIDEHHFSKKQGYATTFCNLSKHKIFDVVLGRSEQDLLPYLNRLKGKDKVKIVVMDLSSNYRSIAKKYFPNAMIVSDRFHVVRLVLHSFIKTAQLIDPNLKKRTGFSKLLRLKKSNLNDLQRIKLQEYFITQPQIEVIYQVTQELCDLLNQKHKTKKECKNNYIPKFLKFIEMLQKSGFELFRKLGKTLEDWAEPIVRMFRFTKSNGITEGFHRKMKLIQRQAYGFRNFENYRTRIRILCG